MALKRSEPLTGMCAYCGERRAVNKDHVVPKYLRKRLPTEFPAALRTTVPSCFECNMRKGTRKLVPPSWEQHIPVLKKVIPGQWRVWDGNPMSDAFRKVHVG